MKTYTLICMTSDTTDNYTYAQILMNSELIQEIARETCTMRRHGVEAIRMVENALPYFRSLVKER